MAPPEQDVFKNSEAKVEAPQTAEKPKPKAEDVAVELGPGGIEEYLKQVENEGGLEIKNFGENVGSPELAQQISDIQVLTERDLEAVHGEVMMAVRKLGLATTEGNLEKVQAATQQMTAVVNKFQEMQKQKMEAEGAAREEQLNLEKEALRNRAPDGQTTEQAAAEQARALEEIDKGWETEAPTAEVIKPQPAVKVEAMKPQEVQEQVADDRQELGSLAQELEANGGYMTDEMAARFKQLRGKVDDLQKYGANVDSLQENMDHFAMLLNPAISPDAPQRLAGLKEFFNENPDLRGAEGERPAKLETPQEKVLKLRDEVGDMVGVLAAGHGAEAVALLAAVRARAADLEKAGAPSDDLKSNLEHLEMIAAIPDEAQRKEALQVFKDENPDLAPAPAAANQAEKKPLPERGEVQKGRDDVSKHLQLDSVAFAVKPEQFEDFFSANNGARHHAALEDLNSSINEREKKIQDLQNLRPAKADLAYVGEQIAALKFANDLCQLRRQQWEKQQQLHEAKKVWELQNTDLAETKDELREVTSMLNDHPEDRELVKRKESLERQEESQTAALDSNDKFIAQQTSDLGHLDAALKQGMDKVSALQSDLKREAEAEPDFIVTGGDFDPEALIEKGFNVAGKAIATGFAGGTGHSSERGLGNLAFDVGGVAVDTAKKAVTYTADAIGGNKKSTNTVLEGAKGKNSGKKEKKEGGEDVIELEDGSESKDKLKDAFKKLGSLARKLEKNKGALTEEIRSGFQKLESKTGALGNSNEANDLNSKIAEFGRLLSLSMVSSDADRLVKTTEFLDRNPDLRKQV